MTYKYLILISSLLVTSCGSSSSSSPKNIFGTDDRKIINESSSPFSSIGRLDVGCTGTLIGKKLLLTAGHCVLVEGKAEPRTDFHSFTANMVNGSSTTTAVPVRAWVGGLTPEADRTTDWAIVELSAPLGETQGQLSVSSEQIGTTLPMQVSLAGYNSDFSNGQSPSVHWNCNIRSIVENKIHHDCDATSGISGAPLFFGSGNNWQIIGISVSEFRNGQTPPVHRDDWSEEYTNVGTPSYLFAPTVVALLNSVDAGQAAPTLSSNIVAITFPTAQQPTPHPGQPQPLPPTTSPSPIFGEIPYQLNQLAVLPYNYSKYTAIQNLHNDFILDSKGHWYFSRQSNNAYYMYAADRFKNALIDSINAYNAIVTQNSAGVSREYLYQCYVNLKSGTNQLMSVDLNLYPPQLADQIRPLQMLLAQHMAYYESYLFFP